ncbi:uncharacterized protein LOC124497310 [Dermatophagoides farinae]|nr:uncharacterized protein LOC124497310 [Dermatophagoides farinae]
MFLLSVSNQFITMIMLAMIIIIITIAIDSTTCTVHDLICESIKNTSDHDDTFDILNVGVTREKIILVTKKWFVYEMDINSMKDGKLYLNVLPTPASAKFPYLWSYKRFQDIKDKITDVQIFMDDEGDWLCLVPIFDYGIGYHIDTNEIIVITWFMRNNSIENERSIGTMESYRNYIFRYIRFDITAKAIQINKDSINGTIGVRNTKRIHIVNLWTYICLTSDNKIVIQYGFCQNYGLQTVDWDIQGGFVVNEQFYLLGKDNVYSFSEQAYLKPNQSFAYSKQDYRSFIYCYGEIDSLPFNRIVRIIFIIIILLLIILVILLFININQRRHHRQKSREILKVKVAKKPPPPPPPSPSKAVKQTKQQQIKSKISMDKNSSIIQKSAKFSSIGTMRSEIGKIPVPVISRQSSSMEKSAIQKSKFF